MLNKLWSNQRSIGSSNLILIIITTTTTTTTIWIRSEVQILIDRKKKSTKKTLPYIKVSDKSLIIYVCYYYGIL